MRESYIRNPKKGGFVGSRLFGFFLGACRLMVLIPRNLRTHISRLLGPNTMLYKAFGLF